jgi:hypothetical protein
MRPSHLLLSAVAALVVLLTLVNIFLSRSNGTIGGSLNDAQRLLQSVPNNRAALRALATRIDQEQDAQLKGLLQQLQINVAPEPAPAR